jgi:hypothetical protein
MVLEHRGEHASEWVAISSIASKIGCEAETLRLWVRQTQRDQALHDRRPVRRDGLIHHSDRGVQLGLNRSSQHPAEGGCDGREAALGSIHAEGPSLAGSTAGGTTRAPADALVGDRGGTYERRRCH